jgi:DNA-binding response OmpR family regulator
MVLVCDRNPTMQKLIVARLAPLGVHVIGCGDPQTTVAWFRELRPSWVVLDSEIDEAAALRAARSLVALDPEARVIMLSAEPDEFSRAAARRVGALGCLPKDNLDALVGMIDAS